MDTTEVNAKTVVNDVRDVVRGAAAAGANVAGWSTQQSVVLALKAEEATTSRIASGASLHVALREGIADADLIIALDAFSKALDVTGSPEQAFDAVAAIKSRATEGVPGADKVAEAAKLEFNNALGKGLSPHAALASAFASAAAISRMLSVRAN
ncbi:MAG: hypothetical protein AAGC70_15990 [Pseudomonadota bacterium]